MRPCESSDEVELERGILLPWGGLDDLDGLVRNARLSTEDGGAPNVGFKMLRGHRTPQPAHA